MDQVELLSWASLAPCSSPLPIVVACLLALFVASKSVWRNRKAPNKKSNCKSFVLLVRARPVLSWSSANERHCAFAINSLAHQEMTLEMMEMTQSASNGKPIIRQRHCISMRYRRRVKRNKIRTEPSQTEQTKAHSFTQRIEKRSEDKQRFS